MMADKPLRGVRVLEIAAIGPAPWAATLLAEQGASVLRVDRPGSPLDHDDANARGRSAIELNLKSSDDRIHLLRLVTSADVLIEGMRPGAMERLELGPAECLAVNPKLVYARMTGWGQAGPLANVAGHDINYIATTGALHAIGSETEPVVPLNLIGDYGGGGMFLLFGLLAKLLSVRSGGTGGTVDVAMVDGAANLMSFQFSRLATGRWVDRRRSNTLDGGVPWYKIYRTADNRFIAVGAIEKKFYTELVNLLEFEDVLPLRDDPANYEEIERQFAAKFLTKSRDEWVQFFANSDACVSPVLSMREATVYPHNVARSVFTKWNGQEVPAAAPVFDGIREPPLSPSVRISLSDAIARWK